MPFSACNLLSGVIAALWAAHISALHALAVEDCCRGLPVFSCLLSTHCSERVMNPLPEPRDSPLSEVVIDRLPVREIQWQHPPTDASSQHVEDGVYHFTHVGGARTSSRSGSRDIVSDTFPLSVGEI